MHTLSLLLLVALTADPFAALRRWTGRTRSAAHVNASSR